MKAEEFRSHLEETIIPFWNKLKDDEYGGFYGYVEGDGTIKKEEIKGVILNSRILWFYSQAYIQLQDKTLLDMAEHAYKFLINSCYDNQYGGVFWSVDYKGNVSDDTKHCYNQAFAIYALSTYYEASKDENALACAQKIYEVIEEKCHDEKGYLEAFHRDFTKAGNDKLSENGVMADRTMNTLLHVLEAYTQFYKVKPTEEVKNNLHEILDAFDEKIYNPELKRCEVFFDDDYNSIIDLESYGHDIEAEWLINRAVEVLGEKEYAEKMGPMMKGLAEGCYEHSIDWDLGAMNAENEEGRVLTTKVWWVQAETVTGFYDAYKNEPDKTKYAELSEKVWDFIQKYVVDKKHGEWVENIEDVNNIDYTQALVQPWKCPYHNGRMCMEMMKRLA